MLLVGEQSKNVPLLESVAQVVATGTTSIISFPQQFFGSAVAIKLTNLDATNSATFVIGGSSRPTRTLQANQWTAIGDTIINLITITAGAAGAVLVEAQVQRFQ